MSTPITVTNLPSIGEISSGDLLIVQTPTQTGTLKFDDFIIGEEHVSFFKDIQDLATDVQILSGDIAPYISNIKEISNLKSGSEASTATITALTNRVTSLENEILNISVKVVSLSGTVAAALESLDDRITGLEEANAIAAANS